MTWRIAFSLLSRSASGFRYLRKTGRSCRLSACCGEARGPAFAKTEFATDSPLEGDGFEPSVPRFARLVHFPAPTPRSGIAEPVAVLVEFGAALLLGPAHLVDDLVDQFNDMEFVEGDLGLWQALGVPAMNAGLMLMHTSTTASGFRDAPPSPWRRAATVAASLPSVWTG